MSLLEKIASKISNQLPGVDWAALEARFGMSREELVYHSDVSKPPGETGVFAYADYISRALARAEVQLNQIKLTFQVEDNPETAENELVIAMGAWDRTQQEALQVGDSVLEAMKAGEAFLNSSDEFRIHRESYRAVISATYLICLYGTLVHAKKLMQFNDAPPEEIIASAEQLTQTLNGLAILGEMGALNILKPQSVGVVQIPVVAAIAIASVLAVGIICFTIVTMQNQSSFNRNIELICDDAIAKGDQEMMARCVDLTKMNKISQNGGPVGDFTASIGNTAVKVAIAVTILVLAPTAFKLLSSLDTGRKAFSS